MHIKDRQITRDLESKSTNADNESRTTATISVVTTEKSDNFSAQYSYCSNGKLRCVRFSDGRSWLKGIKDWYLASESGVRLHQLRGKPSIDPQGNLWFNSKGGIVRRIDSVTQLDQVTALYLLPTFYE